MNMEGVFWVVGQLSILTPVSSMVITNVLSEALPNLTKGTQS